jgi:UDP-glucose 4-epimerase
MLHINDPSPELDSRYRRVNVGGTENVVRAATEAGVRRIVFFSTISVYGGDRGSMITEDDLPQPDSAYAQTKLDAERIVLSASGTVLRLAAVYGPRVKGNYRRLVDAVARRRFLRIGNGRNRRTLVYERDVAAAAILAASKDSRGEIFNVTDGSAHTVAEIVDAIAAAAGVAPPRIAVPAVAARFAAAMVERSARLVHVRPPVTSALLAKMLEDVAVSGEKIQRRLGFSPAYDLSRGWTATIEGLRHPVLLS